MVSDSESLCPSVEYGIGLKSRPEFSRRLTLNVDSEERCTPLSIQ